MSGDNGTDQRYEPLARRLHAAWAAGVSTWEQDEMIQPAFYRQAAAVSGMRCASCYRTPIADGEVALTRVNVKGLRGVFLCQFCLAPPTVGSGGSDAAAQSPQDASGPIVAPAPEPRPQGTTPA